MQRSARLTLGLCALQIAGLLFVIIIGVPHIGSASVIAGASASGVIGGAALVFFAFIGFDEVITLAEETRDPTRVIPRALLAALAISTALYMAVAVAAVSVIGATALAGSTRPLADVMAHVLGGHAEATVAVIALITTMNTSLLALTAASRLMYGMAETGALPRSLGRVSRGTGVPIVAIVVAVIGAMVFALIGDLTLIASVTDFAVYVVFLAVNVTVIKLRITDPEHARPFRIPLAVHGIPAVPVVAIVATIMMIPQLEVRSLLVGLAMLAAGLAVQPLLKRTK
jgi:APA family basic amino acid/polyamine antiporter